MKKFKTPVFITLIALSSCFISCKKSNDSPPAPKTIQGLWTGTASNASSSIPDYTLSINQGGKITYEWTAPGSGQEQFGAGTWTLVGTDFTANLTGIYGIQSNVGVHQTLTAKFDSKSGKLTNGTYTTAPPATDTGTFAVSKVE